VQFYRLLRAALQPPLMITNRITSIIFKGDLFGGSPRGDCPADGVGFWCAVRGRARPVCGGVLVDLCRPVSEALHLDLRTTVP